MPPGCPRRTESGRCVPPPRVTLSSLCVAAAPPPQPCSCQEQVCTEETCANTAACTKIILEICPHGLAVEADDGECHSSCRRENSDQQSLARPESCCSNQQTQPPMCCKPASEDKSPSRAESCCSNQQPQPLMCCKPETEDKSLSRAESCCSNQQPQPPKCCKPATEDKSLSRAESCCSNQQPQPPKCCKPATEDKSPSRAESCCSNQQPQPPKCCKPATEDKSLARAESCCSNQQPQPPKCCKPATEDKSLARAESCCSNQQPQPPKCCKPATADKSQQAPADKKAPPVIASETGFENCCSSCPAKTPSQSTVNANQPKSSHSQCGPDCGAVEKKKANKLASSVKANEEKCCMNDGGVASAPSSLCQPLPQKASLESNCCKSSGVIRGGPHMSQTPPAKQGSSGSRKPSLVRLPDSKQKQKSLGEQMTPIASCCQTNKPAEDQVPTCPHNSAGLFPAKAPPMPCLCVMPPAYNVKCTGNLSGNCTCSDCKK